MQRTGLDSQVDRVISSHQYRAPKEEAQFWQALLADEPLSRSARSLLMTAKAVLESAANWGIGFVVSVQNPDSHKPANPPSRF